VPDYAVFILRFCLFAGAHSLFATERVKRMLAGIAGREPRSYRLIYNLASLVMFIWAMSAYGNSPVLYYAPGVWSLVLYLLQLVLLGTLIHCVRQTGMNDFLGIGRIRSGAPPSPPRLVTDGWYAIVRHPLYFLSMFFLILNPVMTAQWLILIALSVVYFVGGALIEERRLVGQFGAEYRRYQQEVPFMIPRLTRLKRPSST